MSLERQPFHKRYPLGTLSLLGCLSIIILIPYANAQVTNPSTGSTIAQYCSNGICHTEPVPPRNTNASATPTASPIGSVKLSQSCIGNNCSKSIQVTQLGKIGIQLSQVCLMDLKNHLNSTCLNYNDLKDFDNTNPLWAGLWVEQPYEHRLNPKIKNHENFNPNPWVVMVDPNADYTVGARMVTVDNHFTWTNQNDSSNKGLALKSYVDRYVSDDCQEARVGPNLSLIKDTIAYLESNCTANTMNTTNITTQVEIPFSYNNPYSTLHYEDLIKKVTHGHTTTTNSTRVTGGLGLGDCIHKVCSYTDPFKKSGW